VLQDCERPSETYRTYKYVTNLARKKQNTEVSIIFDVEFVGIISA